MKKIYFALLAIMATAFVGCEPDTPDTPDTPNIPADYTFELLSEGAMVFDNMGGAGVIEYKLENPTATGSVEVAADADWIINIIDNNAGQVTFAVQRNNAGEARSANISLTYELTTINVIVNQRSNSEIDVNEVAPNVQGFYYGNRAGGDYNYYFVITNGEMVYEGVFEDPYYGSYDKYSYTSPNAYYYFLDVYATEPAGSDMKLPDGTYTFDSSASGRGNHIMPGFSLYQLNDENGWAFEQWLFDDATLTVKGNTLELTAHLVDDTYNDMGLHFVKFEGDYTLIDDSI